MKFVIFVVMLLSMMDVSLVAMQCNEHLQAVLVEQKSNVQIVDFNVFPDAMKGPLECPWRLWSNTQL